MTTENFEEYYNSLKLKKVSRIKGDGHSLICSVVNCMFEHREIHYKYHEEEVICAIREEIERNQAMYQSFLHTELGIDTLLQQLFEDKIINNKDIRQLLLLAICNCFNVEVVIVKERADSKIAEIKNVIMPNCPANESSTRNTFYLLRTLDHYDALVDYGKYRCNVFITK